MVGDRYRVDGRLSSSANTEPATGNIDAPSGGVMDAWRGHDQRLNRTVTIRVLSEEVTDSQIMTDAAKHMRKAVKVDDPGLTRIYDSLEPHLVGMVCEPIEGADLRSQIAANGPMSTDRARSLAVELAKTLDAIHRAGLVHGCLTASGVGFTSDGRLVISDLGTAATPETSAQAISADIEALAALLHELACGRPPHESGKGRELDPSTPAPIAGTLSLAFGDEPPWTTAQQFATHLSEGGTAGNPPAAGFASAERRWLVPAVVVLVIAGLIGLIGAVASRSSVARDILDNAREVVGFDPPPTSDVVTTTEPPISPTLATTTQAPAVVTEVVIQRITDFDPDGNDGTEHPERLVLINDDDPTRGWQTELYTTREFGNLKDGVGLIIELAEDSTVTEITVRSPTRGWGFELFASQDPPVSANWGRPIHMTTNFGADVTIDVDDIEARSLLLWITDLGNGPQFRVTITDIDIAGTVPS